MKKPLKTIINLVIIVTILSALYNCSAGVSSNCNPPAESGQLPNCSSNISVGSLATKQNSTQN